MADRLAGLAAEAHQVEAHIADGFRAAVAIQTRVMKHVTFAHTVLLDLARRDADPGDISQRSP